MSVHVYVAGPISSDPRGHAREALRVGTELLNAGLAPFVPHLSVWWDEFYPQAYERWLAYDFAWLSRCDALLRLPGASPGADREVAFARERGIPVFGSVGAVLEWARPTRGPEHVSVAIRRVLERLRAGSR